MARCDSPIWVKPKAKIDYVPVPCGQCAPCKMRRVNSWVFRLQQEEKLHQHAAFITLTYDTDHVPLTENGFMTLDKTDVQRYFKRLRKLCPAGIKYYACGEYGGTYGRPHYHAIVFGVPEAKLFAQAWSIEGRQFGIVDVGTVTGDSIAYTLKYLDKAKQRKKHARDDRAPEFALMSKGMGDNFVTPEIVQYYKEDLSRLHLTKPGGHLIALPRYYRDKIYNAEEKAKQRDIITEAVTKDVLLCEQEFLRTYANVPNYTFERYQASQAIARATKFISSQKKRADL